MADGQNLFSGLNNLPVFEGVPDEDRRRALIQAGLSLLQPSPATGQQSLAQSFGGSVQAGLNSLDQSAERQRGIEQQSFENLITGQAAAADTERASAATTTAEASATQAGVSVLEQEERASQFNAEASLRDADVDLKTAQAEWLRRRFAGGLGSTAAQIDDKFIQARMNNLFAGDPTKFTGQDGEPNLSLLMDQAFLDLHRAQGTAGNENIPIIAAGEGEAAEIGANITALQGAPPQPAPQDVSSFTTQQWQAIIDAPADSPERQRILRLVANDPVARAAFQAAKPSLNFDSEQ